MYKGARRSDRAKFNDYVIPFRLFRAIEHFSVMAESAAMTPEVTAVLVQTIVDALVKTAEKGVPAFTRAATFMLSGVFVCGIVTGMGMTAAVMYFARK